MRTLKRRERERERDKFLRERLRLELHPDKSHIISLSKGVDFVGFRNFNRHRLLRKRNIRNIQQKVLNYDNRDLGFGSMFDSYQGWQAYARWADSYNLRDKIKIEMVDTLMKRT